MHGFFIALNGEAKAKGLVVSTTSNLEETEALRARKRSNFA